MHMLSVCLRSYKEERGAEVFQGENRKERKIDHDGIYSVARDLESRDEHHGEHQRTWGAKGGQSISAGRSVCALPPTPSEI